MEDIEKVTFSRMVYENMAKAKFRQIGNRKISPKQRELFDKCYANLNEIGKEILDKIDKEEK